ncbi:MAG: radical SAM protein [Planctomycetota bacterium]|nr:MAG: radical SAM protein [Planctomycetota bacterium]
MKKKLVLINPYTPGRKGEESIRVIVQMPLNLAYLAAHTPRDRWEIDLIDETLETALDENGKLKFEANLVGITALTYQASRAYEIGLACKAAGVPCIMGGSHAVTNTEEALQYVDSVLVGEADAIWPEILKDVELKKLKQLYDGGFPDLGSLSAWPDRDLFKDKYAYKYSSIVTTKGCPWRCEFCSVPMVQGGSYRERPVHDVLDEMEGTSFRGLMFAEDNFYGYKPESNARARQLFRGMVERGIYKDWFGFTQFSTGMDTDALSDMSDSGCLGFLIGMESTDEQVLRKLRKGSNLKTGVDNYPVAIKNIHDHGMIVWASIIWGADFQTKDAFQAMADYTWEQSLDVVTFGIHAPFPNTALFKRMVKENRMLRTNFPEDWWYYDTAHITHTFSHMTLEEFIEGMEGFYRQVYGPENIKKRFIETLKRNGSRRTAMFAYKVNSDWDRVYRQVLDHLYRLRDSGLYHDTMKARGLEVARV